MAGTGIPQKTFHNVKNSRRKNRKICRKNDKTEPNFPGKQPENAGFPSKTTEHLRKNRENYRKITKNSQKGVDKVRGGGYNGLTATDFQSTGKFVDCFTEKFLGGKQT